MLCKTTWCTVSVTKRWLPSIFKLTRTSAFRLLDFKHHLKHCNPALKVYLHSQWFSYYLYSFKAAVIIRSWIAVRFPLYIAIYTMPVNCLAASKALQKVCRMRPYLLACGDFWAKFSTLSFVSFTCLGKLSIPKCFHVIIFEQNDFQVLVERRKKIIQLPFQQEQRSSEYLKSQRLIPKSIIFLHMVFLQHKLPLQLKKCLGPAVKLLILLDRACSQERFFSIIESVVFHWYNVGASIINVLWSTLNVLFFNVIKDSLSITRNDLSLQSTLINTHCLRCVRIYRKIQTRITPNTGNFCTVTAIPSAKFLLSLFYFITIVLNEWRSTTNAIYTGN